MYYVLEIERYSQGYKLMKTELDDHTRIIHIVERPCWNFYTREITECKNAVDEAKRAKRLASGWFKEPHLFETLKESLFDIANLKFMDIPLGDSEKATKVLAFAWTLYRKRIWTMSKHSSPPDCYANILSIGTDDASKEKRKEVTKKMSTHHKNILTLEKYKNRLESAKELWTSCLFLNMQPVRLLHEYFNRDQYCPESPDGRKLLMGLIVRLPDNKIVEDIHAPLRLATKGNSNDRLSATTIQNVINSSNVIQAREIPHSAHVTQDQVSSWAYFQYSIKKNILYI